MSAASDVAGQILDKLSDLVNGPVQGSINATATSGVVLVPQGTIGALPDGRFVRVTKTTKVSTVATPVPARLLYLAPAMPRASNFAPVASGLTVTWQAPPAGIVATGTTAGAFAKNAAALVGAIVEADHPDDAARLTTDGTNGTAALALLAPEIAFKARANLRRREQDADVVWKILAQIMTLAPQGDRRVTAANVYDAIQAALLGATAGASQVSFTSWRRIRSAPDRAIWELTITTQIVAGGRQTQPAAIANAPALTSIDATETVNDDGGQPSPFTVEQITPIA